MLLVLQNLETNKSYEVAWIYNRGSSGYYILINDAKDNFSTGNAVSLSTYSPKLDKTIKSTIVKIEDNPVNSNVCLSIKGKKYMSYFKQALKVKNQS